MLWQPRMSKQNKRIIYTVLEYCPLLDSCNMTTDDWAKIGRDIEVPSDLACKMLSDIVSHCVDVHSVLPLKAHSLCLGH